MKKLMIPLFIFLILFSFTLVQGNQEGFNVPNIQPSIKNIKVALKTPLVLDSSSSKLITFKKPPIKFKPFDYSFFKIKKDQIITLEDGVKISGEEFLKEINEIEQKLNALGYSLRDKEEEIVLQRIVIKKDNLEMQKKLFKNITPISTLELVPKDEPLKEFKNFSFERKWNLPLGDDDFNVDISTGLSLKGEESQVYSNAYAVAKAGVLGYKTEILRVEADIKSGKEQNADKGILRVYILEKKEYEKSFNTKFDFKEKFSYNLDWSFPISVPVGPFNVKGSFGIRGGLGLELGSNLNFLLCNAVIKPSVDTKAFAEVGLDYKVASAGLGGELTILKNNLVLAGSLGLILQDPLSNSYFKMSAFGENDMNALSGDIYFFVKVNYLVGSKKFKTEIYNWDGFSWNTKLFEYSSQEPAYKDKNIWLLVKNIRGITPYTARNEKTGVTPENFYVEVEVGGQVFTKKITDSNKDGIADSDWNIKIPLSSRYTSVPIKIRVVQEYSIRELRFKNNLDLAKGENKDLEILLDLNSWQFTGTLDGKINQEYTTTGDTNYFGERFHSITFELGSDTGFKPAPGQAR